MTPLAAVGITPSRLAVNPSLFKRMPFDPMKDLQPIASVAVAPLV